jgi:hypothetical protein
MKTFLRTLALSVILFAAAVCAQADSASRMSLEAVKANQKLMVAMNMDLTDEEKKTFWPVYDEYQEKRDIIYKDLLDVVNTFANQYQALSDEQAAKILNDYLAVEGARVALVEDYTEKFTAVLPAKKVMRFFQIDFKQNLTTLSDIAAIVPVVR